MSYFTDYLGGGAIKQKLHLEDHGRYNAVIESAQDCEPLLDENHAIRNADGRRRGATVNGTRVAARIPEILYYVKWPEEFRQRHGYMPRRPPPSVNRKEAEKCWRDFIFAKLNDKDWQKLRTDEGQKLTTNHGRMV